jgi:alanine racemase
VIAEITIDLGAAARNAQTFARLAAPARVTAVVKANAYGHGLVEIARAVAPHVTRLAVYEIAEALTLRDAGIELPIHVLGPVPIKDLETAHAARIQLTMWDAGPFMRAVASVARRRHSPFDVHAKIDTGVVRLGIPFAEAPAILERYANTPEFNLVGAFTHLAAAEELEDAFTGLQLARFIEATADADPMVDLHIGATAATILYPDTRLDSVRIGIGLYGIPPSPESEALMRAEGFALEPVLSWRTSLVALHGIDTGTTVGYGRTWTAARPSLIATLPIGYAEGLPRAAGNSASALVRGQRVPIIGRVCMDMAFIDVTDVAGVALGDEVTLIGSAGDEHITAQDLGEACGTIGYEIVARLPASVPRTYVNVPLEPTGLGHAPMFVPDDFRAAFSDARLHARRVAYAPRTFAKSDLLAEEQLLAEAGPYRVFYAPVGTMPSPAARLIIVGLTPGLTQLEAAARMYASTAPDLRNDLRRYEPLSREHVAFRGTMRDNLCDMLDDIDAPALFGLARSAQFFEAQRDVAAMTSALVFPVMRKPDLANFAGGVDLGTVPLFRAMLETLLVPRLQNAPSSIILPLGKSASTGLRYLTDSGAIDPARVIYDFPHPSGTNGRRVDQFEEHREQLRRSLRRMAGG